VARAESAGTSEAALQHSLSVLKATLEATADGVLVVDHDRHITGYNQRFVTMWRVPQAVMDSGDDARLMAHVLDQVADPAAFLDQIEDISRHQDRISFDTLDFKDGRRFERYSLPQRVDGVIIGRVLSFRDVTARAQDEKRRRALDEQRQHGQRMEALGTLAGGIAHDFNNLLTVILGRAELARDSIDDEALLHESLREISEAGSRASDLVRQIREFSQKHPAERRPVAVGAAIDETAHLLREALPAGVDLVTEMDPAVVVQANAAQLRQLVTNLVVNAGHAVGDAGGRVTLTLEFVPVAQLPAAMPGPPADRYACLAVADTGCGMAPEMLARIFEPFFSARHGGRGTGLGLAVVHGIARRHNWAITVESTAGQGATFRVFCPAVSQPAMADHGVPAAGARSLTRSGSRHVLVVDDEPGIVSLVATSLRRLGYQVTAHTDPREGLAAFRAEPHAFDVVLTDLSMPHMSGLDLGRSLLDVRRDLPIVLFTGYNADLSAEAARTAGFRALLSKPITASSLAEILDQALEQGA
jgi:signal transduction histidine kinase/ActR/RegA family two-component response regulator